MRITKLYLRNYRVYEDELELELPPGLVGIVGANGAGKCLPAWTRVWDAETGEGVTIEQFVREHRKWTLGLDGGRIVPVQVTDWHDLGPRPTVVVELESGAKLETAETHPILTDRGCIPATEVRPGDWVAEARQLPEVGAPVVSTDEAFLLGLLLGDGCLTDRATLSASDQDVIVAFRHAVERVFPGCTTRSSGSTHLVVSACSGAEQRRRKAALARRLSEIGVPLGAYVGRTNVSRFYRGDAGPSWETMDQLEADYGIDLWAERCALHGGRAFLEWVQAWGLRGSDAYTKAVPRSLLLLPDEQAQHLLAGLWQSDGHVGTPERGRGVSFTTASAQLAADVRVLLLRLGIGSTVGTRTIHGHPFSNVSVLAGGYELFAALPLLGEKRVRAEALGAARLDVNAHPLHDLIPPSFCADLPFRSRSGRTRTAKQRAQSAMSRSLFLDFGGDPHVEPADTRWSKVNAIRATQRLAPCFDITVNTSDHLYVADTFIVHNSVLLEAIPWTLFGRARTAKEDVRTTGVNGECVTEVEFEHEAHLYVARRTLNGVNSSIRATVEVDGAQVAEGVRDTARFMHSVLGMDDVAFKASVFAEQKQVAAFSGKTPAERQKLVLRLLGITPLDAARDAARKDARERQAQYEQLRSVLPDLEQLRATLDGARADAELRATEAKGAEDAALAANAEADQAVMRFEALDNVRREHDDLIKEGKTVGAQRKEAEERVAELEKELAALSTAADELRDLLPEAEGLADAETLLALVQTAVAATAKVDGLVTGPEPQAPDEDGAETARSEAEEAGTRLTAIETELQLATQELARARAEVAKSKDLSGEGDCPLCGQELGDAFAQVQAHRAAELAERQARVAELETARTAAVADLGTRRDRFEVLQREIKAARTARAAWEQAQALHAAATAELATAIDALGRSPEPGEHERLVAEVTRRKQAAQQCTRLQTQVEQRPKLEHKLEVEKARFTELSDKRATLLDKVKALDFNRDALTAAEAERTAARQRAEAARTTAAQAQAAAAAAAAKVEGEEKALLRGEEQHASLADAAEDARHLGRLSLLLGKFRDGVVATVGPRLAAQAADLFGELTDHEYDRLDVDPDTYELQIVDAGLKHGMGRFSGSETDLANLALRVAISEHVRFQAGGAVGLLVLDEVFGPLDDDRRERMLGALERLKGRFRQVLVVTHATEVKEQLPAAIEVVKLPGRRATARVIT